MRDQNHIRATGGLVDPYDDADQAKLVGKEADIMFYRYRNFFLIGPLIIFVLLMFDLCKF